VRRTRFREWNRTIRKLGPNSDHLLAYPRQPEIGDLEPTLLSDQKVTRLDVAMTVQPLPQCMLESETKLECELERLWQIQAARADPAIQVAPLDQLEYHVWMALDEFH
jgi:hypothetical protein